MMPPPNPEVTAGYARQRESTLERRARGEQIVGWKVGITSAAAQRAFGVNDPVLAPIFAGALRPDGTTLRSADYVRAQLEPEIAMFVDGAPRRRFDTAREAATIVRE